jgi:hypothetical protein
LEGIDEVRGEEPARIGPLAVPGQGPRQDRAIEAQAVGHEAMRWRSLRQVSSTSTWIAATSIPDGRRYGVPDRSILTTVRFSSLLYTRFISD